ncbi:hypothetical protein PCANC_11646 [Puccinia coronata f. sp. avenae]|uniref:Uncharacterized protein n=1 Tax=Puccinia coronata f. sp. avenae TaxID=200324 RepID=A0A2N5VXG6_9BASI|nr:hypothetical protein PCANC_11646 [Puccinia coronata f. sp. avenae]
MPGEVPNGTLIRVPSGTLIRVPNGTLIRVQNGTLIRVPFGTLIRVPGTLIRVPLGTLIRVPFGTLIRVPFGTLIRVPRYPYTYKGTAGTQGTLIRVPGTLIRVPRGTGTLIRVPWYPYKGTGTLIRVPWYPYKGTQGTLIRVPGTLIRAPRGSRKPLDLRGLREPGRTGVHGQHACPAGPHAEPAVLTPFVGVRTACGMRGRACGVEHGCLSGARTAVFDRCSDGHCLTEARANWLDRFVRPVPAGPVQPVPGTDRTGLSDPPAGASVGQCLSDHRSNTAVRAPLKLPCSTS